MIQNFFSVKNQYMKGMRKSLANDNINKIDMESNSSSRRKKRRRSIVPGYYLLVLVLAAGIVATLSFTVFFNIKYFEISSNSRYELVEIAKASKVNKGDNLLRLDTEEVRKNILDSMLYIDDVSVKKSLPFTLKIDLVPSEELAYIYSDEKYVLISRNWRILGTFDVPEKKDLMVIEGFVPESDKEKAVMSEKILKPEKTDETLTEAQIEENDENELRYDIMKELFSIVSDRKMKNINVVDLSDPYDISITYDNRIEILINDSGDLDYKLHLAYQILNDKPLSGKNKKGYLIYHGNSQYSYVTEEDYREVENRKNNIKNAAVTETAENVDESEPEISTENQSE